MVLVYTSYSMQNKCLKEVSKMASVKDIDENTFQVVVSMRL